MLDAKILIGLMVALIIGIAVAVPVISDIVTETTSIQTVTLESLTGTNWTTENLAHSNIIASTFTVQNTTADGLIISSGNYTLNANIGQIFWVNLDNTNYPGPEFANYSYYPPGYQTGPGATMLILIPLLIVIALVLLVVPYVRG